MGRETPEELRFLGPGGAARLGRTAALAERRVWLWRDANGLDTERKFLEALPALFHPVDQRRGERRRTTSDPLWRWETFPGDPSWLDAPSVRRGLSNLWHYARLGATWPLPILARFAGAWTFRGRGPERAIAAAAARRNAALVEDREALSRYLAAVWDQISHGGPTEKSIRAALEKAAAEGRVTGWALPHDPKSGGPRFSMGCDVDVAELLLRALGSRVTAKRGPLPWKRIATEALGRFYGEQSSSDGPKGKARHQRRKPSTHRGITAPRV